jgi:O-antigen/teichoic acid export membrane protein
MRTLSRNALSAIAQTLAIAGLFFEQYRFLARELGAAQFGLWSVVLAGAHIARLSEFGLGSGVARYVAMDRGEGNRVRAARTVAIAGSAIAILMAVVCLIAAPILYWALTPLVDNPDDQRVAHALVPYAFVGLWLVSVSNVFLNAIDGCLRTERRAAIVVLAALFQLLACYALVPDSGVAAMGPVYLLQAVMMLVASIVIATWTLGVPLSAWRPSDRERAWELVRYGGAIQAAAIGQLLFDPTIKMLMARFGGLTATGYYEMASRAVTQMRGIIAAAYQTLVPYIAHRAAGGRGDASVKASYLAASRLLFIVATVSFAATGMALPLVLTFWLGTFDTQFILIGLFCMAGWYVNSFAIAPYMWALALGKPAWITLTWLSIGLLSLVLGFLGGVVGDALGVVIGGMAALGLGSATLVKLMHRHYQIGVREALPLSGSRLFMSCLALSASCIGLSFAFLQPPQSSYWQPLLAVGLCIVLSLILMAEYEEVRSALRTVTRREAGRSP